MVKEKSITDELTRGFDIDDFLIVYEGGYTRVTFLPLLLCAEAKTDPEGHSLARAYLLDKLITQLENTTTVLAHFGHSKTVH